MYTVVWYMLLVIIIVLVILSYQLKKNLSMNYMLIFIMVILS